MQKPPSGRLTADGIQPISCPPAPQGSHRPACADIQPDAACRPLVGDSLTVERWTLTPLVLVRIQVPQPPKVLSHSDH